MEKLFFRHDEAPTQMSLINYDKAMQIRPIAGSLACTIQLAHHCGSRLKLCLGEQ